jgi:hypothetical protein
MKYLSFQCYIDNISEFLTLELLFIDLRTANKKHFGFKKKNETREKRNQNAQENHNSFFHFYIEIQALLIFSARSKTLSKILIAIV